MFLLVASLVLLVSPLSTSLDARSISPPSLSVVDVLVQGGGAAAAVAAAGGRSLAVLPIVDGLLARVPAAGAAELPGRPGVRAVTDADRPLSVRAADPDPLLTDPSASYQEAGSSRDVPAGLGVGVGVLDTGIAASGDLAGRVVASADLSGEWSFTDSYGHGTFMAGLIAGSGQPGGPAGVAPGVDLVDLKVAGADGATTLGQVLAAMQLADAARDRLNLRVLNVSLGAPADDPATAPLTEAVERLWADGITVVAASGNEGGGVDAPGLDPYVVTVGAVDPAGAVPPWSSRGPDFAGRAKPDLVAPGVGLVGLRAPASTIDLANPEARVGDHYFRGSGTSMSTAVVAGAAALVAAAHPEWGPDRVKAALTGTADPLGADGSRRDPRPGGGAGGGHGAAGQRRPFPAAAGRAGGHPQGPRTAARARLAVRRGRRAPLGAASSLPGPTAGASDTDAWTAHPWLSGRWAADQPSVKSWAAQQWLARSGGQALGGRRAPAGRLGRPSMVMGRPAGRRPRRQGSGPGGRSTGSPAAGGQELGPAAWPGDLTARSWAARSWAALAWEARSWAARSWAGIDWTARSWASRRWTAGAWAARSWPSEDGERLMTRRTERPAGAAARPGGDDAKGG